MGLNWNDFREIGELLFERLRHARSAQGAFRRHAQMDSRSRGFEGNPKDSNEKQLEAIQMAWYEDWKRLSTAKKINPVRFFTLGSILLSKRSFPVRLSTSTCSASSKFFGERIACESLNTFLYSLRLACCLGGVADVGQVPAANAQPKASKSASSTMSRRFSRKLLRLPRRKKRSGKYEMTMFEKLVDDEHIIAGKSADSELYTARGRQGRSPMPPKKTTWAPLNKQQTEIIKHGSTRAPKLDGGIDDKAPTWLKSSAFAGTTGRRPLTNSRPFVNALAVTPDEQMLVVRASRIDALGPADGKLLKRIYTRAERAYALAFSADGKLVVAGGRPGQEGDVRIFDINAPGKSRTA